MSREKLFVMYDERALTSDPDDCSIVCTADTEEEARALSDDERGLWYEYDVVRGNELVNGKVRFDLSPLRKLKLRVVDRAPRQG